MNTLAIAYMYYIEGHLEKLSWRQQDNVKYVSQRDCPALGRKGGTRSPSDVYIVLFYFLSSDR